MYYCVAMRGRYNQEGKVEQQLEPRWDGVTNTLTTVQKDNLIMEVGNLDREINMLGLLDMKGQEVVRRVYSVDGIAPTLTTSEGGHRQPKVPTNFVYGFKPKEWVEDELNGLTVNDFFCGGGGMGLGFKQAGWTIKGAWDFDKYAVQSYNHNIGDHVQQADISQMKGEDVPYADLWTYGFPCQDLSIAGEMKGLLEGERSKLFFEIMRLLGEVKDKPKLIMAENVQGLKKYLPVLEEEYKKAGYRMVYAFYNSKYHRVAQNRQRYFVLGIRNDLNIDFTFPEEDKTNVPRLLDFLDAEVDEKYYIDDLKSLKIIEELEQQLKVRQATKLGYDVAVEGDSINISHPNSETRRGRVGKQVAQTLLTGSEQVAVLPKFRVRKLTPREYARLQGFPEWYEQVVSDTQFYKQMGNAVTVNVAYDIAKALREVLK